MSCGSEPSGDFLKAACRLGMTDSETTDEQHSALPSHELAQRKDTYFGQALIQSHLLSHTPKWVVRLLPLWLAPGCKPNQITPWPLGVTDGLANLRYFHPLPCVIGQHLSNCHIHRVFVKALLPSCRTCSFKKCCSKMIQHTKNTHLESKAINVVISTLSI